MIKKVVAKSGPRYQVRVRGADGTERSKTFHTRKEAERFEREFLSGRDRGTLIDPRLASETLNQFSDRWLDLHGGRLRPRTAELYRSLLRRHILPPTSTYRRSLPPATMCYHAGVVQRQNISFPS